MTRAHVLELVDATVNHMLDNNTFGKLNDQQKDRLTKQTMITFRSKMITHLLKKE